MCHVKEITIFFLLKCVSKLTVNPPVMIHYFVYIYHSLNVISISIVIITLFISPSKYSREIYESR